MLYCSISKADKKVKVIIACCHLIEIMGDWHDTPFVRMLIHWSIQVWVLENEGALNNASWN